jgi:UDPglucose--hexose-1-phosphate uridylyltransferase
MLKFIQETFHSQIVLPNGESADRAIEIGVHPITGRTCRITNSHGKEREPGTESLPEPPPFAAQLNKCPFCLDRVATQTPRLPTNL